MKLVGLIKMYLNEMYSAVQEGKHFFDMFPIKIFFLKKGYGLSPWLFNFALGMQLGGFR